MNVALLLLLQVLLAIALHTSANESFDVRQHLSTVTRYGVVKDISDDSFVPSKNLDQCTPIHLNLVARHGTRAPTKKRIREIEALAARLEVLVRDAKEQKQSLDKIPAWLTGWSSPWKGKLTGGELISEGEDELYHLGIRVREQFPNLFSEEYHPDIYSIKATQDFRKSQEPTVKKLKEPIIDEITHELVRRYGLNFTKQDVSSLWFLCQQEASLLNITNQACSLFSPAEVSLLEYADDLESFILKGYGNSLNYRMGVPLLEDVLQSMEQAIKAKEEGYAPGSYEKARLRFAHAETLLPFSCLIGLFLKESEFELIQREQALQFPPKPPNKRNWRGSIVTPFAGNNMLVLYSCGSNNSSKYFVKVLHNERPIPIPGCNNSDSCPFEVFKERIAAPHLKHDYNALCNVKSEQKEKDSTLSMFSQMFNWIFSLRNADTPAQKVEL
ncbi:uncharacterized protein LOC132640411 isoform X3 [Lycium barbarum]|uniref:uncharacterized protein LOC132640411 isoform X3 n=1 Tax=Lycium barbarum TaxID=112863 RepID=UPI00293E88B0|nr:uncharacterized protein LOC132640411 isoform X3 [Lycium barbarum]